jgi:hypothetical protein
LFPRNPSTGFSRQAFYRAIGLARDHGQGKLAVAYVLQQIHQKNARFLVAVATKVSDMVTEISDMVTKVSDMITATLKNAGVFNQRLQQLHATVHGLVSERAIATGESSDHA